MAKRQKMKPQIKIVLVVIGLAAIALVATLYLRHINFVVLNPKGPIARQERNLIIFAALLSLAVVIPVFTMTAMIVWRYRESNTKATYSPEWDHSWIAETVWWTIPSLLILILGIVTWRSTHSLDPYKSLSSTNKPITIQVVALNWKWLFIYPQQGIASVNYLQFPEQTPVNFQITSDATMNSFWIPQLSGQIYAMSGMSTELHTLADGVGSYNGRSANISGEGFAGMTFVARSSTQADFNQWVRRVKQSPNHLDSASYESLAQPSQNNQISYYSAADNFLYDKIVLRSMPDANTFSVSGLQ